MNTPSYDTIAVGDTLPSLTTDAISRYTLALYAGASGDHHPLHIDSDYAKASGVDDVFAHGMLVMAYLGRFLTDWGPQQQLRDWTVRFGAITHLQDEITCTGKVIEKLEQDGERLVRVEIQAANQNGEAKLVGDALIALP